MTDTENRLFTRQQAVCPGQPMRAVDLHDTGPFVVFKKQRAFDAAGGHHHTGGPNFKIALIKIIGLKPFLKCGDQVVVIDAHCGGLRKYANICILFKFVRHLPGTLRKRYPGVILRLAIVKKATQPGPGFQQDDPQPVFGCCQGRRHARRPSANYAYIRFGINLIVGAGHLKIRRNCSQSGGLAHLFEGNGPYAGRFVHRAVIKSGRHCPVQFIHEPLQIRFGRAHNILGFNLQALFQEGIFSTYIGNAVDLHAGIAAFTVQTVKAPGAMIFQAAPKDTNTVGIKGGRNRIAADTLQRFFLILERNGLSRIDSQRGQFFQPVHDCASDFSTSRLHVVSR